MRTLVSRDHAAADAYEVRWDGMSDGGLPVASGVYFCELKAAGAATSIRIALLR